MKIVATVYDFGAMMHVGGPAEVESAIIEIPEEQVPFIVRRHLKSVKEKMGAYASLSFSLLSEDRKENS